jgi:NADH-quinone oxidoreductase subunit C
MTMSEETKEPNPVSVENSAPASSSSAIVAAAEAKAANPGPPSDSRPIEAAAPPLTGEKPAAAAKAPVAAEKSAAPAATKPVVPAAAKPAAAEPAKPAPPKPEAPKPEPWNCDLVCSLKAQYGSGIREASTCARQNCLVVDNSIAWEILLRLRDDETFKYCVDITAVHYPKREVQFDIVYILYSFHKNERLRIKTQVRDGEHVRSVVAIWSTADWLEREVFDMFGIVFDEHPELKRILMPDDWQGHPLRKDYGVLQQDTEWVKNNIGIESGQ